MRWLAAFLSLFISITFVAGCSAIVREVARESITHQIAGDWRAQGGGAIHLKDDGTFAGDLVLGKVQGSWRVEQPLLKLSAANGRQIDLTIVRWDFAAKPAWMILSTDLGETTFYRGGLPIQSRQVQSQSSPPSTTARPPLSAPAGNWTPNYAPSTCTSCGGGGKCSSCHGGGISQCFGCGGSGQRQTYSSSSDPMGEWSMETCSTCGGSGVG